MATLLIYILSLCLYISKANIIKHTSDSLLFEIYESAIKTDWIEQPIDHSNEKDTRKWFMRYFKNEQKWRNGGPVYIFIGGEHKVDTNFLNAGLLYELAEETNGAMFATEHRYYGEGKVFEKVTRENIQYLTSEQALADLAYFIQRRIKNNAKYRASKVVLVGGSYAGNLAAWMRLRHPELVDAAVSSSAPVLAKLDFQEFLEKVGQVFKKHSSLECNLKMKNLFKKYRNDLSNKKKIDNFKKKQNICWDSDLTKSENLAEFFDDRIDSLLQMTQTMTADGIKENCDEAIERISATRYCKKPKSCCPLEFDVLYPKRQLQEPVHKDDYWTYQQCNEFGHFFTAPEHSPLKEIIMNVDYSIKACSHLFGDKFTKEYIEDRIEATNAKYGGLQPNVTNVIFVHGKIDPWKKLGIVKQLSETAPALTIKGASHCNDLYSNEANTTTPEVKRIKKIEKKYIKKWIQYN